MSDAGPAISFAGASAAWRRRRTGSGRHRQRGVPGPGASASASQSESESESVGHSMRNLGPEPWRRAIVGPRRTTTRPTDPDPPVHLSSLSASARHLSPLVSGINAAVAVIEFDRSRRWLMANRWSTVAEKERLAELVAANTPLSEIREVIGRDRWTTRRCGRLPSGWVGRRRRCLAMWPPTAALTATGPWSLIGPRCAGPGDRSRRSWPCIPNCARWSPPSSSCGGRLSRSRVGCRRPLPALPLRTSAGGARSACETTGWHTRKGMTAGPT